MSDPVSSPQTRLLMRGALVALAGIAVASAGMYWATRRAPGTSGGPAVVRRLMPDQYRQVIADVFGQDIKLGGRFEPDVRSDGLLAVGAARVSVTGTGL